MTIWTRPLRNSRQLWSSWPQNLSGSLWTGFTEPRGSPGNPSPASSAALIGQWHGTRVHPELPVRLPPAGPGLTVTMQMYTSHPVMTDVKEVYLFINLFYFLLNKRRFKNVTRRGSWRIGLVFFFLNGLIQNYMKYSYLEIRGEFYCYKKVVYSASFISSNISGAFRNTCVIQSLQYFKYCKKPHTVVYFALDYM